MWLEQKVEKSFNIVHLKCDALIQSQHLKQWILVHSVLFLMSLEKNSIEL